MKKVSILFIGLIVFCIFIIRTQVKSNTEQGEALQGIFKINGWIAYAVHQDVKNNYLWGRLDAELKQNSDYEIIEIKLDNEKFNYYHHREGSDYELYLKPFELAIGDTLELSIGIRKKGEATVPENIKYHVVASFKVNNLYKNVIFPQPNRPLDLDHISGPNLKFEWKFTDFLQPTIVNIMSGDKKVIVKEVNEDHIVFDKKIFEYGSLYEMEVGVLRGPDLHFSFTGLMDPDSELTFSHTYTLSFSTMKRSVDRKK